MNKFKMFNSREALFLVATIILCSSIGCQAVRCYQCSSDSDPKGEDHCGAYEKFDKTKNIPIDCNNQDSKMPGTFCVKEVRQSPRGFIWDGRWRQVIRRCASVASTGVTGVCNWGVDTNGVYWEECSCAGDSCNGATTLSYSVGISILTFILIPIYVLQYSIR